MRFHKRDRFSANISSRRHYPHLVDIRNNPTANWGLCFGSSGLAISQVQESQTVLDWQFSQNHQFPIY
ncbi:MAG: hypothetical protein F6K31_17925 [Symploca sp. SIO2G7]|nr:hypothetical protein [Symploca sp. SIO2G7]